MAQPTPEKPVPEEPVVIKLKLRPAKAPDAALRYQLLPPFLDRTSGNAAPLYYRAMLRLKDAAKQESRDKVSTWLDSPLKEVPRDEAQTFLDKHKSILSEVDQAARRDHCDWGLDIRVNDPLSMILFDVAETRFLAQLLAVRTRLQMQDGRYDDAVHTFQTGFALARHINQRPLLIDGLVGLAVSGIMCGRVQELSQLPGAPNLYWALTALPRPIIDLREACQVEGSFPYLYFPFLRDAETAERTPEEWRKLLLQAIRKDITESQEASAASMNDAELFEPVLKGHSVAKAHLFARGYSQQRVEKMPVGQAVAIYIRDRNNELRDSTFKWMFVPYWELPQGADAASDLFPPDAVRDILPFATTLLETAKSLPVAAARGDRHIAELRVIEALRMYAAGHNGKLPSKLSDITEVPLPIDPFTGKSFEYRVEGETGVLELAAPPHRGMKSDAKRYELTVESADVQPKPVPAKQAE